jgi:hypothetical protein
MTGYFRDGYCRTDISDRGSHTVCALMSEEFLQFSRNVGNDLSTPLPMYDFPGLKPGDFWCLCALRWKEALDAGFAPLVRLEATSEACLTMIDLQDLVAHAYKTVNATT